MRLYHSCGSAEGTKERVLILGSERRVKSSPCSHYPIRVGPDFLGNAGGTVLREAKGEVAKRDDGGWGERRLPMLDIMLVSMILSTTSTSTIRNKNS